MSQPRVCVVLPAAGIGERMGILTPKQFCVVLNRPLISYTLDAFERVSWITHVIVSVSADRMDFMQQIISTYSHDKVFLVEGASARHRSIYSGVKAIERVCPNTEVVIIHDAVRPFIDEDLLLNVTQEALIHGAAGVTRPLVSTVIATDMDGYLDHSLDRSKYRASEMPQAFRYSLIKSAYEKCTDYDLDYGTECLDIAQRYGNVCVRLIEGPDNLWKITHRKDLFAFESLIKAAVQQVNIFFSGAIEDDLTTFIKATEQSLRNKFYQDIPVLTCQTSDGLVALKEQSFNSFAAVLVFYNAIDLVNLRTVEELTGRDSGRVILIHVILCQNSTVEATPVMNMVKENAESSSFSSLVYGIVVEVLKEDCCARASDIVASLVFDHNAAFRGQTFLCV